MTYVEWRELGKGKVPPFLMKVKDTECFMIFTKDFGWCRRCGLKKTLTQDAFKSPWLVGLNRQLLSDKKISLRRNFLSKKLSFVCLRLNKLLFPKNDIDLYEQNSNNQIHQ